MSNSGRMNNEIDDWFHSLTEAYDSNNKSLNKELLYIGAGLSALLLSTYGGKDVSCVMTIGIISIFIATASMLMSFLVVGVIQRRYINIIIEYKRGHGNAPNVQKQEHHQYLINAIFMWVSAALLIVGGSLILYSMLFDSFPDCK